MTWTAGDVSGSQTLTTSDHLYAGMINELRVGVDGVFNIGYYNVKAYGAKGDGVTNDTAAINAAIAALPTAGGVVFFPHGVYVITSTITIKKHGVWLLGEAFISTFADQVDQQPGITGGSVIQASLSSFPASTPMIVFGELATNKMWTGGGVDKMLIHGTKGTTTPGDGIQILNVQAPRVTDCGITKVARGIYVSSDEPGGISNVDIDRNIIYFIAGIAVDMESGSDENYVRSNYISNATGHAIKLSGIGNTVLGNHLEGMLLKGSGTADGAPIYIDGSRNFIFNNDILTSPTFGIYCAGSHTHIVGNHLNDINENNVANGSGIWTAGSLTDVTIIGNAISDSDSHMVYGLYDTSSTVGGVNAYANSITGYVTAPIHSTNNTFSTQIMGAAGLKLYQGDNNTFGLTDKGSYIELQSFNSLPLAINDQGNNVAVGQTGPTAALDLAASSTSRSSLRIRSGTAPTSPNDGDIWYDGTHAKMRIGSTTYQLDQQTTNPVAFIGGEYNNTPNSAATIGSANRAYLQAITVLAPVTVTKVAFVVTVSSGNMDVGLYNNSGTRLASSGSTAVPAAGSRQIAFTGSVAITPGIYYLAIAADNNTATFERSGIDPIIGSNYFDTSFPLPSSVTLPGTAGSRTFSMVGLVSGGISQ